MIYDKLITWYNYTITNIKLINYNWSACSNSNSFRLNYLVLSGILVWFFPMKINYSWIKLSLSSNPESSQILAVEFINSSMLKLPEFTK